MAIRGCLALPLSNEADISTGDTGDQTFAQSTRQLQRRIHQRDDDWGQSITSWQLGALKTNQPLITPQNFADQREDFPIATTVVSRNAVNNAALSHRLAVARNKAKAAIAKVAMHLNAATRAKLISQIDLLHDEDEWPEGDTPLEEEAIDSFLRFFTWMKPTRFPSLGLSSSGNLVAVWGSPHDEIVLEFGPKNSVRYVIDHNAAGNRELLSADTSMARVKVLLQPFAGERWFN